LGSGGTWNSISSANLGGKGYGSGGAPASSGNSQGTSGAGGAGIVIVTEIAG